jgi:Cu2+-exporting ATPase
LNSLRRRGFLVTRSHALDALADATLALLDKTGTLTAAAPTVEEVLPLDGSDASDCLRAAASLEACSTHPLAAAFAVSRVDAVSGFRNHPGLGLEGRIGEVLLRLGEPRFAVAAGVAPAAPGPGKWVLLSADGAARAWFRIADPLRPDAPALVSSLMALGLRVSLLSGDSEPEVARAAGALGIAGWRSGALPADKLAAVRAAQHAGERVLMAGDGINDVAVLAGADVSVAVTSAAEVSRASADCMILSGGLARIPEAIACARRTRHIVRQNLAWAVAYNLAAIPFAAAGFVPPWLAAIGMSASSLLVVANALRLRNDAFVAGHV